MTPFGPSSPSRHNDHDRTRAMAAREVRKFLSTAHVLGPTYAVTLEAELLRELLRLHPRRRELVQALALAELRAQGYGESDAHVAMPAQVAQIERWLAESQSASARRRSGEKMRRTKSANVVRMNN